MNFEEKKQHQIILIKKRRFDGLSGHALDLANIDMPSMMRRF